MVAEAMIISGLETNIFLSEVLPSSGPSVNLFLQGELLVWDDFFSGLPSRVETWFRALFSRWRVIVAFILGLIISGIVEGESLNFWQKTIRPWFGLTRTISNVVFLLMVGGWIFLVPICVFLWGVYGSNRR